MAATWHSGGGPFGSVFFEMLPLTDVSFGIGLYHAIKDVNCLDYLDPAEDKGGKRHRKETCELVKCRRSATG